MWAPSHLRQALDGVPALVLFSLVVVHDIREPISQLLYEVVIGILQGTSPLSGQVWSEASLGIAMGGDFPTTHSAPHVRQSLNK